VFMLRANPVESAVLEQWGIRVLTDASADPEHALESFLARLVENVMAGRGDR
jgi:hypothetical protein